MSAETELSLLEWGLGIAVGAGTGFATIISVAFSQVRDDYQHDMDELKKDTGNAITAMWAKINQMSENLGNFRVNAGDKFATKQDVKDATAHIDRQFEIINQTLRDATVHRR